MSNGMASTSPQPNQSLQPTPKAKSALGSLRCAPAQAELKRLERMKTRTISSVEEVDSLLDNIQTAAITALGHIEGAATEGPISALWKMKFEPLGCDPIDGTSRLNLIEQLNQSFTYAATALAIRRLFSLHPGRGSFRINLGTAAGYDIESEDPTFLAAEVFAAVTPSNNQKLKKDLLKLAESSALHRYVFFMAPGFEAGRQERLETQPGIQVWTLGGQNAL